MATPFYVSQQLVNYLYEANYGNGLAHLLGPSEAKLDGTRPQVWEYLDQLGYDQGRILKLWQQFENRLAEPRVITATDLMEVDVRESLRVLFERQIASTPLLILLFALIVVVNGLKSNANDQRIHYDATMLKYFDDVDIETGLQNNTRWYITREGKVVDITPTTKLIDMNKSAFQRLRDRPPAKIKRMGLGTIDVPAFIPYNPEVNVGENDDWGFLHSMVIIIVSYFRIPNEVLSSEERSLLISIPSQTVTGIAETNTNIIETQKSQHRIAVLLGAQRAFEDPLIKIQRSILRKMHIVKGIMEKAFPLPPVQIDEPFYDDSDVVPGILPLPGDLPALPPLPFPEGL